MRGYEAIAEALEKEGVKHLFTVAAEDNMELLTGLNVSKRIEIIPARKEAGAAGMADGYSRVTGKPGVCMVTLGPGLTNTATSLTTARMHQSPVICITTELSVFDRMGFKGGLDQRRFGELTAGRYISVRRGETLAEDIRLAFHHVRSGAGPVVLGVPIDIMKGEVGKAWTYSPATAMAPAPQKPFPDPDMIARAAEILRGAKRPVILAGRGAFDSGAEQEIRALAEHTGGLLATTLRAKGYLADHPFHVGTCGGYATPPARSLLAESDCVVAVGCSLNAFTTNLGMFFANIPIIHIDRDPQRISKITPVSLGIVGDARASLSALNAELVRQRYSRVGGFWNDGVKATIAVSRQVQTAYEESPDTIDPRQLVAEIDKMMPTQRIVAIDAGHFETFVVNSVSTPDPSHMVSTIDFGSVGMGLYQGIGAAVGRPDQHVVVFAGDGGFMMTLEELDTAVRKRIPLTLVIMNDNAFGVEAHMLRVQGMPLDVALYDNPDLAAVARALGAVALTVRTPNDLQAVAKAVGRKDGPVVIDAKVNPGVVHEVLLELAGKFGDGGKHAETPEGAPA